MAHVIGWPLQPAPSALTRAGHSRYPPLSCDGCRQILTTTAPVASRRHGAAILWCCPRCCALLDGMVFDARKQAVSPKGLTAPADQARAQDG